MIVLEDIDEIIGELVLRIGRMERDWYGDSVLAELDRDALARWYALRRVVVEGGTVKFYPRARH